MDEEAARYIGDELGAILEDRRYYDDIHSMYYYLRPIKYALDGLQGNGTNLTDGLVSFDELEDYFQGDNEIWNIFHRKWELCASDLWQASACVDLRYNENYNKIENDPDYEKYLEYHQNNQNSNNNNNNNNNNNRNSNEKSIFDSIVTSFRSPINGRGVQRSIDDYLNGNENDLFNNVNNRNNGNVRNRVDLIASGTFVKVFPKPDFLPHRLDAEAMTAGERGLEKQCNALFKNYDSVPRNMAPWDFVRPAYLEFRAARGVWNPLGANFQS